MLSVKNLTKTYQTTKSKTKNRVVALDHVSIDFPETGLVFLLGKSGSGKSTLLNAIGGLDTFDSGEIIIKGKSSANFSQSDFDSYRNTFIGFIFQEYNILENFTVAKNLALAIELQGKKADKEEINKLLEQVDMLQYAKRKPNQLSGGQKQRVAIARALIKNPEIIMADEPTGALDSNTGKQVMETLKELSKTKLIIIVSHDRDFAETYGDRIIELKDGKIIHDVTKKEVEAKKTNSGLSYVDDKYIHIKKGQKLTADDMAIIKKCIEENSEKSDTFISLDEDANKEVKKAECITDDGNQEAFSQTLPEDIKSKTYDGKSLKLIRSKLKFKDSFKMGASALKSKVFKLVFTIFLSFFAFTIFGLVDTVSCWNRADSVAKAMEISGTKSVLFKKEHKKEQSGYSYNQDVMLSLDDYKKINDEYGKDILIKGLVGRGAWSDAGTLRYDSDKSTFSSGTGSSTSAETKFDATVDTSMSGFAYFTNNAELERAGFTITGRLPNDSNEVAISKHHFDSLKYNNSEITSYEGLYVKLNDKSFDLDNNYETALKSFKVVGVVDDGTDFSKYSNVTEDQLRNDRTMEGKLEADLKYTFASVVYVSEQLYNYCSNSTQDAYIYAIYNPTPDSYSNMGIDLKNVSTLEGTYQKYVEQVVLEKYRDLGFESKYDSDGNVKFVIDDNTWHNLNGDQYNFDTNQWEHDYGWYSRNNWEQTYDDATGEWIWKMRDDGTSTNEDIIKEIPENEYPTRLKFVNDCFVLNNSITPESLIGNNGKMRDLTKEEIILPETFIDYEHSVSKINSFRTSELSSINIECNNSIIDDDIKLIGLFKYVVKDPEYNWYESVIRDCSAVLNSKYYEDVIEPKLKGYWYVGAVMSNDNTINENFIRFCENFNSDSDKYTILNSSTGTLDMFESMISTISTVFLYVAIGFAVFASLLLMNFISTSISYKKREIGVLRALGARGSDVFGIFFNESAIIAMINFVLATIATMVACYVINIVMVKNLGIQIVLLNSSIRQPLLILAISLATAFISSLIPVIKISKKKPIDAINNR